MDILNSKKDIASHVKDGWHGIRRAGQAAAIFLPDQSFLIPRLSGCLYWAIFSETFTQIYYYIGVIYIQLRSIRVHKSIIEVQLRYDTDRSLSYLK